jgi:ABC-type uncharacterized transport system auxiliary subunit
MNSAAPSKSSRGIWCERIIRLNVSYRNFFQSIGKESIVLKYSLFGLIVSLLFSACGQAPQTHYYALEYQLLSQPQPAAPLPLFVQNFDAGPLLDQDHLLYKPSIYELKLDPYRLWAVPPNQLLTDKAREYFQTRGIFSKVLYQIPPDREAYELIGHVQHFEEIVMDSQHTVHVAVWFELTNISSRALVLSQVFEKNVPVSGNQPEDIIKAMSEATLAMFDDLANALMRVL